MYSMIPNYIHLIQEDNFRNLRRDDFVFGERIYCIGVYSGWVRGITRFESGFNLISCFGLLSN